MQANPSPDLAAAGGFMDLRQTIEFLEREGELRRVRAEVDWDRELGALTRKVLERKGPALLYEAIKGYRSGRCTRLLTSVLAGDRRFRQVLGFAPDTSNRDLVRHVMKMNRVRVEPKLVASGPVKDVVLKGAEIDLDEFPVPRWHFLEGGRYINTFASVVTRDPDTGIMNVGVYRGMINGPRSIGVMLAKGVQDWGRHFAKYAERNEPMPVACVIGWDPIMDFIAGSPIAAGICEYDVMGGYRGAPVELVKCETNDLLVPAGAEIVIEGSISPDPATYELEGPFGDATGHRAVMTDLPIAPQSAAAMNPSPLSLPTHDHRRKEIFQMKAFTRILPSD